MNAGLFHGHSIFDHHNFIEDPFGHSNIIIGKHSLPPNTIKITKTVAVKIPVPHAVPVPHSVPYPVPIPVHRPFPVEVPKIIHVKEQIPIPFHSHSSVGSGIHSNGGFEQQGGINGFGHTDFGSTGLAQSGYSSSGVDQGLIHGGGDQVLFHGSVEQGGYENGGNYGGGYEGNIDIGSSIGSGIGSYADQHYGNAGDSLSLHSAQQYQSQGFGSQLQAGGYQHQYQTQENVNEGNSGHH